MPLSLTARRRARRRFAPSGLEDLETRQLLSGSTASSPVNPSFDPLIGAAQIRQQDHVDGSGLAAAVIDTGADYNNPALGGGFGPGYKVEAGHDFAQNDPNPMADTWSHGTSVAGLIASSAPNASGVAPGADLVPLRVIGNNNQGSYTYVADALQWVVDNHAQDNITVVNVSLSDGGNYTSDPFVNSSIDNRISSLIEQLRALDIPVVCASGNSFDGTHQGMGYMSILSDTISVTATDQQNHLVSDAQRLGSAQGGASATDIAAPGSGLVTTSDNNTFATVSGTSFATPLVTGSILLLQQIYESRFGHLPSVSDVQSWLTQGSDPITDSRTGITIGKLDLPKAASLIPQPASTPSNPTDGSTSTDTGSSSPSDSSGSSPTQTSNPAPPANNPTPPPPPPPASTTTPTETPPPSGSTSTQTDAASTPPPSDVTTTTQTGTAPAQTSTDTTTPSSTTTTQTDTSPSASSPGRTSASIPSTTTTTGTRSSTSDSPSVPIVGPTFLASPPIVTGALPSLDRSHLRPRMKILFDLRHRPLHAAGSRIHTLDRHAEQLALWKAFRERRQLFRLASSVSGR